MNWAYCRVSSKDQNLDRQIEAMKQAGIDDGNIIAEKESGKDMNRPAWIRLMKKLKPGDTLTIKSIDRLGRNYDEIIRTWREISERDVGIIVLDMPILNTAKDKDLTGRLISDIVLQLLSYVAQTEREFIKQRQKEGIAIAKEKGVRFGRQPKELPPCWKIIMRRYCDGEIRAPIARKALGLTEATFYRKLKEYKAEAGLDQPQRESGEPEKEQPPEDCFRDMA